MMIFDPLVFSQIHEAYQETPHVATIALKLGLSIQRVRYALRKSGALYGPHKGTRPGRCDRQKFRVIMLARMGMSLSEIGRQIGVKNQTVRKFLRRNLPDWEPNMNFSGSKNNHWKGGRSIDKDGYILLHRPEHPFCNSNGQVREHRLVMEQILGRYLSVSEVVHHVSKNKQDNSPDNLELFSTNGEHLKHELTGHCPKWSSDGMLRIRSGKRLAAERKQKQILGSSALNDSSPS